MRVKFEVEAVITDIRDRGYEASVILITPTQRICMARRAATPNEAISLAVGFAMDRLNLWPYDGNPKCPVCHGEGILKNNDPTIDSYYVDCKSCPTFEAS